MVSNQDSNEASPTWLLAGIVVEMILGLLQEQVLYELVTYLLSCTHFVGVQIGGGGQNARGAWIYVLCHGLCRLLLPLALFLVRISTYGSVQRGRDTDVQHATAQDENGSVEATTLRQMLDQNRQDEAAGRSSGYTNAICQGSMFVKVLGHNHYARSGGEASADS